MWWRSAAYTPKNKDNMKDLLTASSNCDVSFFVFFCFAFPSQYALNSLPVMSLLACFFSRPDDLFIYAMLHHTSNVSRWEKPLYIQLWINLIFIFVLSCLISSDLILGQHLFSRWLGTNKVQSHLPNQWGHDSLPHICVNKPKLT